MSKTIYHNHHITPKCLLKHKSKEFVDHPSNIIRVELRHHITLHKWLFMLTGDAGCESAYYGLLTGKFTLIKHTTQTKQKISKANKGRSRPDIKGKNHFFYGKSHTKEQLKQNRIKHLGKNNTCHKKWTVNGKIFYSLNEASIFFNVHSSTIRRWCLPESKYHIPLCYVSKQNR